MSEHEYSRRLLSRVKHVWLAGVVLGVLMTALYVVTQHDVRGVPTLATMTLIWLCGYFRYGSFAAGYDAAHVVAGAEAQRRADSEIQAHRDREAAARQPCKIVFPHDDGYGNEGFLYILKFSTTVIKVGQTMDLPRRTSEHRRSAEAFGVVIVDCWFSGAHENYVVNEVDLIVACDELASWRSKREYFWGLEFEQAVQLARSLTYRRADGSLTGADGVRA